jgi:hypothetical protein
MHYRRIVALLLGLWLGGELVMAWFGARSFASVDRTMNGSNPIFAVQTRPLGHTTTRMVLRYQIAEENRYLFQGWEYMQLILGAAFFSYLLFGTLENKFTLALALGLLLLTGVQRFGISSELGAIGKTLDYLPPEIANGERARFWLLHSAYLGVEALKIAVAGVLLSVVLRRTRSVDPVNQFDMVDKANHRHVNW